jgi:hypothetical protein
MEPTDLKYPAALNGPQFLNASVLKHPLQVVDGELEVPTGIGLGVEVRRKESRETQCERLILEGESALRQANSPLVVKSAGLGLCSPFIEVFEGPAVPKVKPDFIEEVSKRVQQWRRWFNLILLMTAQTARAKKMDPVIQFQYSLRTGWDGSAINRIIQRSRGSRAGSDVLDTTDSAIMFACSWTDLTAARDLLMRQSFPFIESCVVAVEVTPSDLARLMACLLQAELNLNYLYSFIPHPEGKSLLALSMEDDELAQDVLRQNQFRVLSQGDSLPLITFRRAKTACWILWFRVS